MKIHPRQYKQLIKDRARKLRNNPTRAEQVLWEQLRMGRFHGLRFLRQRPILHSQKGTVHFYIPDFYCSEYKLILEVDGSIHTQTDQQVHDEIRTHTLVEMGYIILRFSNDDVLHHMEDVLFQLSEWYKKTTAQR